jgi:hypothetical protein
MTSPGSTPFSASQANAPPRFTGARFFLASSQAEWKTLCTRRGHNVLSCPNTGGFAHDSSTGNVRQLLNFSIAMKTNKAKTQMHTSGRERLRLHRKQLTKNVSKPHFFFKFSKRMIKLSGAQCDKLTGDRKTQSLCDGGTVFCVKNFVSFIVFRCEEHLYTRLRRSVRPSVGWSVPHDARLREKLVMSRLLREEEEEEETDYVAIPLRRDSFAPRD